MSLSPGSFCVARVLTSSLGFPLDGLVDTDGSLIQKVHHTRRHQWDDQGRIALLFLTSIVLVCPSGNNMLNQAFFYVQKFNDFFNTSVRFVEKATTFFSLFGSNVKSMTLIFFSVF